MYVELKLPFDLPEVLCLKCMLILEKLFIPVTSPFNQHSNLFIFYVIADKTTLKHSWKMMLNYIFVQ